IPFAQLSARKFASRRGRGLREFGAGEAAAPGSAAADTTAAPVPATRHESARAGACHATALPLPEGGAPGRADRATLQWGVGRAPRRGLRGNPPRVLRRGARALGTRGRVDAAHELRRV